MHNMPYEHVNKAKGTTYVLHTRAVELKGGRKQVIYFFCKKGNKPASGKPCDMPDGKKVGINQRTGLPFLANSAPKATKKR
jgi:hypothetical protein